MSQLREYYDNYYRVMGDLAYTGDKWSHTSRFLWFKQELAKISESRDKPTALDIGCGSATFTAQNPRFAWTGLDVNLEAIPADRAITKIQHDIEAYPYPLPDAAFDVITCSEVLEHLMRPELVIKEAKRLLKRDGVLLLSTPQHTWIRNLLDGFDNLRYDLTKSWTMEHIRTFDLLSHTQMLNAYGFKVDYSTGFDGHFCPLMNPIAMHIRNKLEQSGVTLLPPVELLHLWMGEVLPSIQHTIGIRAVKV